MNVIGLCRILVVLFAFALATQAQEMDGHHHSASSVNVSEVEITQDWSRAQLAKSPRHHEWVKVKSGNREVNSFIVYPESKEKATAVVVIHEIFGMSDWVQQLTDELAEAGYIAIAPDLLSGAGPQQSRQPGAMRWDWPFAICRLIKSHQT